MFNDSSVNLRYEREHPLSGNVCPITGLRPQVDASWVHRRENYCCRTGVLEPGIAMSFPVGHTHISDARVFFRALEDMKKRSLLDEKQWVLIEDYTLHAGATLEARTSYINQMESVIRPKAIIFVTQSKLWRISIRGGLLLSGKTVNILLAANMAQAMELASQLLHRPLLGKIPQEDPGERPGFSEDGFSVWMHAERGDNIRVSYMGKPTVALAERTTKLYHSFVNRTLARFDSRTFISIHDFRGLERASFRVSLSYVRGMFPANRVFSPRLSIVVGRGRWINVGIHLAKLFTKTSIFAVETIGDAENMVLQNEKHFTHSGYVSLTDPKQLELVGHALDLLDNLRWDYPGYEAPLASLDIPALQPLARAIADLKQDVDNILRQTEIENRNLEKSEVVAKQIAQENEAAVIDSRNHRKQIANLARENMALVLEISKTQKEMLEVLSGILDRRARQPAGLTLRIARIATFLARKRGLNETQIENLYFAACVHNVGLLGMPDRVAAMDAVRDDEDEVLYRQHPLIGAEALDKLHGDFLQMAAEVTLTHHENWDGTGYPRGLAGEGIPLYGRLLRAAEITEKLLRETNNFQSQLMTIRKFSSKILDPQLANLLQAHLAEIAMLSSPHPQEELAY